MKFFMLDLNMNAMVVRFSFESSNDKNRAKLKAKVILPNSTR